jgi:HK97 family phage portal protein
LRLPWRRQEERALDANAFMDLVGQGKSATGRSVTPASALTGTVAVYAAISLLAETTGSLPCFTYRRIDDRNRERVSSTPMRWPGTLARTLHESPNPEMTAPEYWETVVGHCATWGNHFTYIERDGYGRPQQLWPLRPDMMEVLRLDGPRGIPGPRAYVYTLPSGQKIGLNRNQVLHVMDFGTDGTVGMSPLTIARNAVAIEQAAAEYAGRFFGNSAIPGGILHTPTRLDEDAAKVIKETWQSIVGGLDNAQKVAVLHSGIDWKQVGIPPRDAQFIELRRFQIEEVARLYRIPLHLLADTTNSTSWGTGIEQMTIGFVVYTLRARLRRIESAINRDLGDVQGGHTLLDEGLFSEFQVNALLRGDMTTRSAFYASGIQNGWLTPEDVRALENLPYLEGLDRPWMPSSFGVVATDGTVKGTELNEPEPEETTEVYEP